MTRPHSRAATLMATAMFAALVACSADHPPGEELRVISYGPMVLEVGDTATLVGTPNTQVPTSAPSATIRFSSTDPTVATVDPTTGLARAVGVGTTNIVAADAMGQRGSSVLTVSPHAVRLGIVSTIPVPLEIGDVDTLVVNAYDANGNVVTGVPFTWSVIIPSFARFRGDKPEGEDMLTPGRIVASVRLQRGDARVAVRRSYLHSGRVVVDTLQVGVP